VLRSRATEHTQIIRSAAKYGPPRVWPGEPPLAVAARVHQPGVAILTLSGEADVITIPLIGRAINQQLLGAPQRVTVDMSHVTLLASAGISQLVEAQRHGVARNFDVVSVKGA
jgi:ABC-type transporter Mla MlaB component